MRVHKLLFFDISKQPIPKSEQSAYNINSADMSTLFFFIPISLMSIDTPCYFAAEISSKMP